MSGDSTRLITGCADQTAKLWDVQTGAPLYTFNFDSPVRAVDFSVGDKLAVITTDPFMEHSSSIQVKMIARDITERMNLTPLLDPYIISLDWSYPMSLYRELHFQTAFHLKLKSLCFMVCRGYFINHNVF